MKKLYFAFFFLFSFSLLSAQSGPKCDFHIRSVVDEATCWNSGTVTITAVDGSNNPLYIAPTTADPNPYNNLSTIKYGYRKISVAGDTVHWSNDNVLSLDSGRYMVMAEVLCCDSSIIGEGRYTTLKDSNIVNVVLSYTRPTVSYVSNNGTEIYSRGSVPSLPCINTGREQFTIKDGKLPYMIRVHNTDLDKLDTIFFFGRQYSGNNDQRYDYENHYSVDSLAPGHYDFYVEDGCEYKWSVITLPNGVDSIEPPTVTGIKFDGWSTTATDSNVIKTIVTIKIPHKYYTKDPGFLQYRFIHKDINGITDTTEWRALPYAGNNNITVYDNVSNAHSYCDIRNKEITFEARSTLCDRTYSKTQTIKFPLDSINSVAWYHWSGSYADSNVLRAAIKVLHVNNNPSSIPEIKYRFIHKHLGGSSDTTGWKYYTNLGSKPMGDVTIDVFDTIVSAHNYCDIFNDTVAIEAQLTSCKSTFFKSISHIWEKPHYSKFNTYKRADTVVASYVTEHYNQCGFVPTHPVGLGFPHYYIEFEYNYGDKANNTTQNLRDSNINFQATYPLTWTYTDTSTGRIIKTERLQNKCTNSHHDLALWNLTKDPHWGKTVSVLRHQDVEPIYGSLYDTSYTIPVRRTLTDGRGCVLHDRVDNLSFELNNVVDDYPATPQEWTAGYKNNNDDGCSTTSRYVYIKATNYSQQYSDGTVVRLYKSPLGNKYNFTAVYDLATDSWDIHKDSLSNLANIEPIGYDEIRIRDINLPSGTYKFSVTTQCGPYERNVKAAFPNTYSWEVATMPSYTRDSTCTILTIKPTAGQYRLISRNTDDDSGPTQTTKQINMKFQIIAKLPISDPQNTFTTGTFNINQPATISAPGRYVIKITPSSNEGLCTPPTLYDTINFAGGAVSFKYALGYVCNSSSSTGYVRVKATEGTPPYTYTLYSGPDKSGTVMDTNSTGVFNNVNIHSGQVVSVSVQDKCMASFHVNQTIYEMEQLNKAWFQGEVERADVCEGHYISFYAVGLSDDVSYHWTGPDGYTSDTRDTTIFIPRSSTPGWYKVVISNTGCNAIVSEDSVYVDVVPSPWVEVLRDTVICPGQPVTVEFIPHGTGNINYTVACRENNTVTYTNYNQPTSVTFSPTSSRSYWVSYVEDDICPYTIADDTVKVAINDHIATSCDVITQSEPICHSTDGEVLASSTLAVPYYVKWYRDPEQTQWLRTDTIYNVADYASYAFTGLLQDTSLYVTVSNSEYCESRYGTVSSWKVMTPSNISLRCGESILLFDDGGQNANYAPDQDLFQTFTSSDGQHLTISFEALDIDKGDKLLIYSGAAAHNDSLLAELTGDLTSSLPGPFVSAGSALTLRFLSNHTTQKAGFQAMISNNPKPASADLHVLDTLSTELVIPHVQVHYDGDATVTANAEGGRGDSYRYSWETSVDGGGSWTSLGDSISGSSASLYLNRVTQATHVRVSISDASANPCVGTAQADIFIPVSNIQLTLDLSTPDQQQCESNYPATITVQNHKPGTAHNVTVKLGLPENVAPLNPDDTLIALGDIAGNGSVTVTINLHNSLVPAAAVTLPVKAQIWSCSEGDSVPTVLYGDWDWDGAPRQADEDVDSLSIKPVMSLAGYHLTAQDDAVCYNGTAVLRATSDVDMPQYIRWYADPALRTLLKTDTLNATGESSEYTIELLVRDTTLYITLENDGFCPAIDSAATYAKLDAPATRTMNHTAGSTLVGMADKIKFYDTGGPTGNYGNGENIIHTFSTSSGQVVLRLNSITLSAGDRFCIYDGPTATGAPIYLLSGNNNNNNAQVFTSTGGMLTVAMYSDGATVAAGWNADIASSTNYLSAVATASLRTVYKDATLTATNDTVCIYNDAALTARSDNAVYFTWLAGDQKTIVLQDTVTGHESTLPLHYVLKDATYYVAATPASACPIIPTSIEQDVLLNIMTDGKTTTVNPFELIHFYDDGGKNSSYSSNQGEMTHTFTSGTGNVHASINRHYLSSTDTLIVYDAATDDEAHRIGVIYSGINGTSIINFVSSHGSLTFKFKKRSTGYSSGWDSDIFLETNTRVLTLNTTITSRETHLLPTETVQFYDEGGPSSSYLPKKQILSHTFTAVQGHVRMQFADNGELNTYDTLYIYDGAVNSGVLKGKYTVSAFRNQTFTSTSCQLSVKFVNNSGTSNTGWNATVTTINDPVWVQAHVTIKAPANDNHLLALDTLVCYGADAKVTAASSSSNFPQMFTWYGSDYEILKRDTIYSPGASELYRPDQRADTYYLVSVKQGNACPSRSPIRNVIVLAQSGTGIGSTTIQENERIRFYDNGNSGNNYANIVGDYVHTFTAANANCLNANFSQRMFGIGDTLFVYDGPTPNIESLLIAFTGTSYFSGPIVSSSPSMTFKFSKRGSSTSSGWNITISSGSEAPVAPSASSIVWDTSFVGIKAPLPHNHITATHDTVCYDNTATLHASSTIGFPQYYTWYKDDGETLLHRDTAFNAGDISTFLPDHQKKDSTYFVIAYNDTTCPYLPAFHSPYKRVSDDFLFNSSKNNKVTLVSVHDSIPFYDDGGPSGIYHGYSTPLIHTFTAESGNIVLRLDKFSSVSDDDLIVYDGNTVTGDSLGKICGYLRLEEQITPIIFTSSGSSLTLKWTTRGNTVTNGWEGVIYSTCNDSTVAYSTVRIKKPLDASCITATHDTVCYNKTATLHASSSIAFPQYYAWYENDGKTLLHRDTAFAHGDISTFQPINQKTDSLYFVVIHNDTSCPFLPTVNPLLKEMRSAFIFNADKNKKTTFISNYDSIPFFNEKASNINWVHTFTAVSGKVVVRLDKFDCDPNAYILVYDGIVDTGTTIDYIRGQQSYACPIFLRSSGNSLTIRYKSLSTYGNQYTGWKGFIYSTYNDSISVPSTVHIKAPLRANYITATHDTVCYDNTATLHASSSIAFPQYYSWYQNDGETLLHRDTAFASGDISTIQPEHQTMDSLYFVTIQNDTTCPYIPAINNQIKIQKDDFFFDISKDGGITHIQARDSIPFYDEGGPTNYYSSTNINWTHTFTSQTGNVVLKLDDFYSEDIYSDYLMVYDGSTASGRTLGGDSQGRIGGNLLSSCPIILTSSGNSLTVKWVTNSKRSYRGWKGSIYSTYNDNLLAPSTVHIKIPLEASYITATHDTVCYNNTATLHATSDIAFPQYYSWYKDDGKTLLHRDTAFASGDLSTFQPEHQIKDSLYYVTIYNDTACPYLPAVHDIHLKKIVRKNFLFNSGKNGKTTYLTAFDSIPFYDEGGPSDNYSTISITWTHTFTSQTGNVVLKLDDFYSQSVYTDYMTVYDGNTASGKTLGGDYQGRIGGNLSSSCPIILTSSGNSLTVQWTTNGYTDQTGWKGSVYSTNDSILTPSTVNIKEPLQANYITSTHDTVCYDHTATLQASSTIGFPQYYTWYKSDTTLLYQDTVQSGNISSFYPEHQIIDSLYYVTVHNDTACPFVIGIRQIKKKIRKNFLFNNAIDSSTTFVTALDSIPFFDNGGPDKNYNRAYSSEYSIIHTFIAPSGQNLILRLDKFNTIFYDYGDSLDNIQWNDYLTLYDGNSDTFPTINYNGSQILSGNYNLSSPIILKSTGNSLTIKWYAGSYGSSSGWEGFIYTTGIPDSILAASSVKVCPVNTDTVYQATCQSSTPYNYDNFHNVDVSLAGTLVIDSIYQNQYGCDSTVTLILTVNPAPVLSTTSSSHCRNLSDGYIDLSVSAGTPSFEIQWSGKVSGSHTMTAPGTYRIENLPDSVYDITVTDTKGCSATLKDTVSQIDDTLTITANSHAFDYDGTAHSDNGFTVDFDSFSSASASGTVTLPNGDIVNATITGSITEVSESPKPNTVTAYSVYRGADDVTCEYAVKTIDGQLTINAVSAPLRIQSPSREWDYNGKYDSCTTTYTVTFNGTDVPECTACTPPAGSWQYVLPTNDTITISDPIRVRDVTDTSNTFTLHIQNGAIYTNVDTVYGNIRIKPINLTISTDSSEKIFDGLPLTAHSWLNTPPVGLAPGDTVVWVDIYGSITDMGDSLNRAHPIAIVVNTSTGDTVTSNYNISYNFGTLSVYGALAVLAAAAPDSIQSVTCNGSDDGSGTFVLVGGKPGAHTYSLDGGIDVTITSDTIKLTHLTSGNHTLAVTDLMGNTDTLTFTVGSPEPLVAHISVPTNIADRCPNQGTYTVTVNVTGGTKPYNFVWGKDANNVNDTITTVTQTLANDCGKEYEVTILVTDSNLCSAKDTARFSVIDTLKPTFAVPGDITLYLDGTCSAITDSTVTGKPTVLADNCTPVADLVVKHSDTETPGCGSTKTIVRTWTVTDACGNVASKTQTISVLDSIKPTITTTLVDSTDKGCNWDKADAPTAADFTVNDECKSGAVATVTTTGETHTGCSYAQTWIANYTDDCGLKATPDTITYTWTVDTEKPVIASTAVSGDLGCNPGTITAPTFTVTDNCEGSFTLTADSVTVTGPTNSGCSYTQSWTAHYTDACGNKAKDSTVTFTWTVDTEKPVISSSAASADLGCNPGTITAPTFTVTDACEGSFILTADSVTVTGPDHTGCDYTQSWTAHYTDACGNKAKDSTVTYTWTETTTPTITTSLTDKDFSCIALVVPPTVADFSVNDACDPSATVTLTEGPETVTGYVHSKTWTATYKNACDQHAVPVPITYKWKDATTVSITCPADVYDTLDFGDCEMKVNITTLGTPTTSITPPGTPFGVTNDFPTDSVFSEGENFVRWVIIDSVCGYTDTCTQRVMITFPKCPDAVDCEGYVYHGVRIGCDCRTQRNLESKKYSDCTDIPCVYEYVSETHPNVTENVARYGRLYCFEAAIRDSADNGHGHIQGICPAGWYLPTPEKYEELGNYGVSALKYPSYWISADGTNTTGFSALPAGYFNGTAGRFEGLLGETYFWSTSGTGASTKITICALFLGCNDIIFVPVYTGMGYSVRCIKEKEK